MKKGFFTLFLICCFLTFPKVTASAHNIVTYRLNSGIGDWNTGSCRFYWIDSNSSLKKDLVTKGIDGWNHSTNYSGVFTKLNFEETTYKPSSIMDFYGESLTKGINGITTFWESNTEQANPYVKNWNYCIVKINTSPTAMNGISPLSDWRYIRTSSHEMGHVLGFDENNSEPDSIMCQTGYCSFVFNYPIKSDIDQLNSMY